jgi:membrane-bound serine protease (ClpP class)
VSYRLGAEGGSAFFLLDLTRVGLLASYGPMRRNWRFVQGVFVLLVLLLMSVPAYAAEVFVHVRIDGVINPIKARHLERARLRAEQENAKFLLVTLDTPGGLVSSMQEMVAALTNSKIPVVGFTAPRSAQATSAGAFILLATDFAAMAPGTRIGAAHPVADGKALDDELDKKATNSLASLVKSLAERRGRPAALAEAMVRDSVSYTAEEAHEKKLVELLTPNEAGLLSALDGRELRPGKTVLTRGLTRIDLPLSLVDRALDKVADPSITSLLISLGTLAILYELGTDRRPAAALRHGVRLLHDLRERGGHRRDDRPRPHPVPVGGPRLPDREPAVAPGADLPDQ